MGIRFAMAASVVARVHGCAIPTKGVALIGPKRIRSVVSGKFWIKGRKHFRVLLFICTFVF